MSYVEEAQAKIKAYEQRVAQLPPFRGAKGQNPSGAYAPTDEERRAMNYVETVRRLEHSRQTGSSGSSFIRARAEADYIYSGGSQADFQAKVREEDRNREISRRQSIGLGGSGGKPSPEPTSRVGGQGPPAQISAGKVKAVQETTPAPSPVIQVYEQSGVKRDSAGNIVDAPGALFEKSSQATVQPTTQEQMASKTSGLGTGRTGISGGEGKGVDAVKEGQKAITEKNLTFQFGSGQLGVREEPQEITTKNLKEFLFEQNKDAQYFQVEVSKSEPRPEVTRVGGALVLTSMLPPEQQKAETEVRVIPKETAYREVLTLFKEGKGFSITPLAEETGKFEQEKQTTFGLTPPEKIRKPAPIEDWIVGVQESRKKFKDNPILGTSAGALEGGLGLVTSTVNLMRQADRQPAEKMLITPRGPAEYPIGLALGTIQSGDFFTSEAKARSELKKLVEQEGLYPTLGKAFADVLPFGKQPLKAIPIRSPTFKALTESGEVMSIRTVDVGYGSKTKDFLTITERRVSPGSAVKNLGKSRLGEIEAVDRGLEFATQGRLGTKILTSPEGLTILEKAGKALPRDVRAVTISPEITKLLQLSAQKVPNVVRKKTEVIPEQPLSSLQEGAESKALVEEIIPTMKPIKGTLAETVQLEEDLLKVKKPTEEEELLQAQALAASNEADIAAVITGKQPTPSRGPLSGLLQTRQSKLRSGTTGDLDVEYSSKYFGVAQATAQAEKSAEILNKFAGKGRKFVREGTNVVVKEEGKPSETVINLVTQKDAKKGYLNKPDFNLFGIKVKGKPIKVSVKEGSEKAGKFVPIEEQASHRLESSLAMQGPKSDKYKGLGPIPYLKEGTKIQTTEKGYTFLPTEHRLKDLSKMLSQDTEQISRNLKKAGLVKEGERLKILTEEYKSLYPEIDFTLKAEKTIIEESATRPSIISSVGKESQQPSVGLGLTTAKGFTPEESESRLSPTRSATKPIQYKSATKSTVSPLTQKSRSRSTITSKPSTSSSKTNFDSLVGSPASSKGSTSKITPSLTKSLSPSPSSISSSSKAPSTSIESLIGSTGGSPSKSPSLGKSTVSVASPGLSPGSPGSKGSLGGSPSKSATTFGSNSAFSSVGPKKLIALLPNLKSKRVKSKPTKPKPRADFLGNVPVTSLVGVYRKRPDILYGRKRTSKLVGKEITLASSGKFTKGSFRLSSKPIKNVFTTKKKQKSYKL